MLTIFETCFWFHFVAKKLSLLKHGRIDIVQCLRDLPKTRHHPGAFSVDVIRATVSSVWPTSFCLSCREVFLCVCGKLSRDKSFVNFEVFWLFLKVFFTKLGGMASFGGTSKELTGIFSVKIIFSLKNFPLYGCKFTITALPFFAMTMTPCLALI